MATKTAAIDLNEGLRLKGTAWYLRMMVKGRRRDFALQVYGGEEKRGAAQAAAAKFRRTLNDAQVTARVMAEHGITPQVAPDAPVVATFGAWWQKVKGDYATDSVEARAAAVWMDMPVGLGTWETTPIDQIKKSDCVASLNIRRKQHKRTRSGKKMNGLVSEGTVRRARGAIQAILQKAVDDQILPRNPWDGIEKGTDIVGRRNPDGSIRLLMPEDEVKLLAELVPRAGRWVQFVLETGFRLEGARDLPDHLVRQIGTGWFAHVSEKASKKHEFDVCPICKRVGKKCREIPLLSVAQAIIKAQIKADGQLWSQLSGMASIQSTLAQAARRAGINHVSPHVLRHTFGHRWIKRGGSVDDLSRVLGHSDSRITRKNYAHLLKEDLADKMRAVMEPNGPIVDDPPVVDSPPSSP